jgi:polyribonucleotide nucleotidyltransferase
MGFFFIHQVMHVEDTTFSVFAPNQAAMNEAKELIDQFLTTQREPELEFGGIYTAKIVEVRDIGVMVTLYSNMTPALLHNSQLDQRKVRAKLLYLPCFSFQPSSLILTVIVNLLSLQSAENSGIL